MQAQGSARKGKVGMTKLDRRFILPDQQQQKQVRMLQSQCRRYLYDLLLTRCSFLQSLYD